MSTSRAAASDVALAPELSDPTETADDLAGQAATAATAALRRQVANARRVGDQTLASVAQRSGLSTAYISQIESGAANPTVRSLAQLAAGLGCELADLFGGGALAAASRFEPRFAPLPLLATSPGYGAIWDLTAVGAARLRIRLVHGSAGDHAEHTSHPGEEVVVVLAGTCTLRVGAIARSMRQGESCHLAAADPHAITEPSDDALLLVILTEE